MKDPCKPFRIAFRSEGEFVNVYMASTDTMQDAILVGSMLRAVLEHEGVMDQYKEFIKSCFTVLLRNVAGVENAGYVEETAPEHERSGRA